MSSVPSQPAIDASPTIKPELTGDDSEVSDDLLEQQLAEIVAAQLDQMQRGQSLDMEALIAEHPRLAAQIQEVWPALLLADVAGHSSSILDEPTSSHRAFGSIVLGNDQTPEAIPTRMGDYETGRADWSRRHGLGLQSQTAQPWSPGGCEDDSA